MRGHFIQRVLCILAQHGLSRLEQDFGLCRRLVLVDVGNDLLDRIQASVRVLRGLLRGLRLVASIDRMLIRFVRLR